MSLSVLLDNGSFAVRPSASVIVCTSKTPDGATFTCTFTGPRASLDSAEFARTEVGYGHTVTIQVVS